MAGYFQPRFPVKEQQPIAMGSPLQNKVHTHCGSGRRSLERQRGIFGRAKSGHGESSRREGEAGTLPQPTGCSGSVRYVTYGRYGPTVGQTTVLVGRQRLSNLVALLSDIRVRKRWILIM